MNSPKSFWIYRARQQKDLPVDHPHIHLNVERRLKRDIPSTTPITVWFILQSSGMRVITISCGVCGALVKLLIKMSPNTLGRTFGTHFNTSYPGLLAHAVKHNNSHIADEIDVARRLLPCHLRYIRVLLLLLRLNITRVNPNHCTRNKS